MITTIVYNQKGASMDNLKSVLDKNRYSNFELLRIISMLLVLFSHLAVHGIEHSLDADKLVLWSSGTFVNKFFTSSLNIGGNIGVALFFMISGFFLVSKEKVSISKVLLEGTFYGIFALFLFGISYICGYRPVEINTLSEVQWVIKAIFNPSTSGAWWFLSAYIVLMLLAPIINKVLNHVDKKGFLFLLLILWFIYSIDNAFNGTYFDLDKSVLFYSVGAYISRFINRDKIKAYYLLIVFNLVLLLTLSVYFSYNSLIFSLDSSEKNKLIVKLISIINTSFLFILIDCLLFVLFYSFSFQNKFINYVSSGTFGVYLIHDSLIGRSVIWRGIIKIDSFYKNDFFPFYALLFVVLIYLCCTVIDIARRKLFEEKSILLLKRIVEGFKQKHIIIPTNNSETKK